MVGVVVLFGWFDSVCLEGLVELVECYGDGSLCLIFW